MAATAASGSNGKAQDIQLRQGNADGDEVVPAYDDLLESALDKLDDYQSRREGMDRYLKSAFFDLARAKQALGPSRVGPASFRLGRTEPLITVDIETGHDVNNAIFHLRQSTPSIPEPSSSKGKEREKLTPREFARTNGAIDLRVQVQRSTTRVDAEKSDEKVSSRLRSRLGRRSYLSNNPEKADDAKDPLPNLDAPANGAHEEDQQDRADPTPDMLPPTYTEAVTEYLVDPIQQFSAFPPVTLRNSQRDFRRALQEAIKVLSAQRQYEGLCGMVDGQRSDLVKGS